MRIKLVNGGSTYYLAGQSGVSERTHSSAGDISITTAIDMQTAKKTRATNAALHDRLNEVNTISFSTTRVFSSPDLAEQWSLDHGTNFGRTGTLYLETISSAGVSTWRYLQNAIVPAPARRVTGCTVTAAYTVTGGAITSSP